MNLERVEEVLGSVNALVRGGMDWRDLERLIEGERKRGNAVARMIEEVRVGQGKVVVRLQEEEEEEDEGSGLEEGDQTDEDDGEGEEHGGIEGGKKDEGRMVKIELDLGLSAYANAREYFDRKKVAAEKV
jgi:predicted ribosome quality control (RQC) complex YloA/Tae2 family protein